MVCEACNATPPASSCPVCNGNTKVDKATKTTDPVSAGSATASPPHASDEAGPKHSVDNEKGGDSGTVDREESCSVCHNDVRLEKNQKCMGCGREGPPADA